MDFALVVSLCSSNLELNIFAALENSDTFHIFFCVSLLLHLGLFLKIHSKINIIEKFNFARGEIFSIILLACNAYFGIHFQT